MSESNPDVDPVQDEADESQEKAELTLQVQVEKPSTCQRHVVVNVAREEIDRYVKDAINELVPKAEVAGFRPGKAPRELVAARFREQVREQAKGKLLMDSMEQVTEQQDFSAISEPDLDYNAVVLPDEGDMTFEFKIEVRPEFDLPGWQGLALERPTQDVTDKHVDAQLDRILDRFAKTTAVERGAQRGDRLLASILAEHEGATISQTSDVAFEVCSSLSFPDGEIDGFDKLIEGAKAGDEKKTAVVLSDGAEREELRGKSVDVTITVNEVRERTRPTLTPSFLDQIGGFESEDELREMVREELQRQVDYQQQQRIREQIAALLTANADWELPPDLLRRQSGREMERAVLELQRSGFTADQINERANQLKRNVLAHTERALKEHFIFERIAEDLNIEAAPEDYDVEVQLIAKQRGESARRVRARLEKRGQMDTLRNQIIERKVVAAITDAATFTDVALKEDEQVTQGADVASIPEPLARAEAEIPEAQHGDAQDLRTPADRA